MQLRSFEEFRKEVLRRLKENESNWKSQAKTFKEYIANNDAENYIKSGYDGHYSYYAQRTNLLPEKCFNSSVGATVWNIEMS